MSTFTNGTWHFRAQVDPSAKRWEVTYKDHANIGRRQCFHTEEQAQRLADATGGKVTLREPRGKFKLAPITGQ